MKKHKHHWHDTYMEEEPVELTPKKCESIFGHLESHPGRTICCKCGNVKEDRQMSTGPCDCVELRKKVRELEAELTLYKRVAEAAQAHLDFWTMDTSDELRNALDALPEDKNV